MSRAQADRAMSDTSIGVQQVDVSCARSMSARPPILPKQAEVGKAAH